MQPYLAGLKSGVGHLQQATMWLMQYAMAKPDNAGAGSYDYMHLFGLVAMGYMAGCKIAKAAQAKKAADAGQAAAMDAKLIAGKFYMERLMPETAAHLARLRDRRRHDDGAAGGCVLTHTPERGSIAFRSRTTAFRLTEGVP